jgi:hypothetical protein
LEAESIKLFATERQIEYLDAYEKYGSFKKASEALGVNQRTMERSIARAKVVAAKRGYAPEHDMTHPAAPGFSVSGTSTYYDKDGNKAGQWVKTRQDEEKRLEVVMEALESFEWKPAPTIKKPSLVERDLLTLYTLTDFHLGMYAWADEAGDDWDLKIATQEMVSAVQEMADGSPNSECGILNLQGDFLHWDGLDAVTPASKHVLDADTRFGRLIDMALDTIVWAIDSLLAKHEKVKVIICEGNHDLVGSLWIRKILKKLYSKNPRLEVDDTEFPYYAHLHGSIMLGFHHGHKTKNKSLPALFASEPRFRKMWGDAAYCYIHTGHYHHTEQDMAEGGGAIVERHPTLSGRDAYAARGGYVSWRAAHAITYHKDSGECRRVTVTPRRKHATESL